MLKKIVILLFLLTTPCLSWSANIYVDQTLVSDCTSGNYSIANRDCSGSDGNAYNGLQEALLAMADGDDLFLRGGTYTGTGPYGSDLQDADFYIPYTTDGTPENHCSIQSYPGEWAVLVGSGDANVVLGHVNQEKDGSFTLD